MPDASPESGANCATRAPGRIEQIGSGVCIVLFLACALFDAPYWLGQLLIAWGIA